jgi:hypothetical protein
MAANKGLEGRINQIASRPTDPDIEAQLDRIRTAEAIQSSSDGPALMTFVDGITTAGPAGPAGYHAYRHANNLRIRIARAKENYDAAVIAVASHLTETETMRDLIKSLKVWAEWQERAANPRRLQLLGALSSIKKLPGTTTSHPTDPSTGTVLERNAAGGPTALIAQMIGNRNDGSAPHIHTTRPPPGPPGPPNPDDDLYAGGRRRTRRRRYTQRR